LTNITGRDGFIIARALAYAIEAIDRLPQERRAMSDRDDMEQILSSMYPHSAATAKLFRIEARHTLATEIPFGTANPAMEEFMQRED
jgi:hypothetical protein